MICDKATVQASNTYKQIMRMIDESKVDGTDINKANEIMRYLTIWYVEEYIETSLEIVEAALELLEDAKGNKEDMNIDNIMTEIICMYFNVLFFADSDWLNLYK